MAVTPESSHVLIELTCPHCRKKNSVAIKRGVNDAEYAEIKCAHCQHSWGQVLPGEVPLDSELPDKRRRARYPFVAEVTIGHFVSGAVVDGVTTDLSESGCGTRVSELFASGTNVLAKITKNGITLATPGTVAYSLPSMAMGLAFGDMLPDQKQILVGWLRAAIPTIRRNARE